MEVGSMNAEETGLPETANQTGSTEVLKGLETKGISAVLHHKSLLHSGTFCKHTVLFLSSLGESSMGLMLPTAVLRVEVYRDIPPLSLLSCIMPEGSLCGRNKLATLPLPPKNLFRNFV